VSRTWAAPLAGSLLGLSALLPAAPASAAPPGSASTPASLPQLMQLLGRRRAARAQFEETQYVAILTRPLHSAGTLSYRAPDHLEERIERPHRQLLLLDHELLSVQLGHHRRSVPLQQYPQLAPLLQSLLATLSGDATALQRSFSVQLRGPLSHWQLVLTPRDDAPGPQSDSGGGAQFALRRITLQGMDAQIEQLTVEQRDGDRSVMRLRPLP